MTAMTNSQFAIFTAMYALTRREKPPVTRESANVCHCLKQAVAHRRRRSAFRHPPSAFTLVELLLVLGLLTMMAAMAWPALERPFSNHRLERGGRCDPHRVVPGPHRGDPLRLGVCLSIHPRRPLIPDPTPRRRTG